MQRSFYIEAFLHKAEADEISPGEANMILSAGFFRPGNAEKAVLPAVEYKRMAPNGVMHFAVDGETQMRTREQVLDLTWELMKIGTVPAACIDALRDIQARHPQHIKAWEERLAQETRPSSPVAHEDNVVQLPVRRKIPFVGPVRPARTANL